MLKRLVVGLVLGALLGGLVAAGLVVGLKMPVFGEGLAGGSLAYLAAAVTGVLTGLVAGKPIWAADGKIEAGLKAFFGALIAAAGMWAMRRFVNAEVDLSSLGVGAGEIGELPALALPGIAALLGAFFELDNTGEPAKNDAKAGGGARVRVGGRPAEVDLDERDAAPVSKKLRR